MRLLNGFMRALLHSPLHHLASATVAVLSFTGRKTGRTLTTPISYLREGNTVTLFTRAPWRKNLKGGALVRLWIQRREYSGWAVLCENDPETIAAALERFLSRVPGDARFYNVRMDEGGLPNAEDVYAAAQRVCLITVQLSRQKKK
jgi:hypothetical protein